MRGSGTLWKKGRRLLRRALRKLSAEKSNLLSVCFEVPTFGLEEEKEEVFIVGRGKEGQRKGKKRERENRKRNRR